MANKIKLKNKISSQSASLISTGVMLYEQGDVNTAKKIFLKALKKNNYDIDALYHLGNLLKDQAKYDEATTYFNKIIEIDPNNVNAYFQLGGTHIDLGNHTIAEENFLKVISLAPNDHFALFNLGLIKGLQGDRDEAIRFYKKAIALEPKYTAAYHNIGCLLLEQKKYSEAFEYTENALSIEPNYVDALFNLGFIEMELGNYDKAVSYYKKTIEIKPDYVQAICNLGFAKQSQDQIDEATKYYEKAISIDPNFAGSYINLGNIYRDKDLNKALEFYKKAVELDSNLVSLQNLCGLQKEMCNYNAAFDLTLKMMEYKNLNKTDLAGIHDTFIQICEWEKATEIIDRFRNAELDTKTKDVLASSLMEFCGNTDLSLDEISELHKIWGELTEKLVTPFQHDRNSQRYQSRSKPRIGYVSPDLREHSVGYLIKDIIKTHNHKEFEVYCYANFFPQDGDTFTQEMINSSNCFKYIRHLSDKEVAEEIFNDEIDILIDLAGHTAYHRLRSFAYKPAPIQMTYLGYPNTTGLSRIDYRITDRFAETTPDKDFRYSELLIRLTNCFLTFNGFLNVLPDPPKEIKDNKIIFGCFNNIQKITPKVIELWANILKQVDNSYLHLKAKQLNTPFVWANIENEFKKYGVTSERILCLGYAPTREDHLKCYNEIDIALDTFPYNGTVTTLEALWMNIPLVTLVGESHAQRVGHSILKNLNLDKLITFTEEDYISRAVELAHQPEMIRELKTKMRKRLIASSICNPIVFTRELELNLKKIWTAYRSGENFSEGDRGDALNGSITDASRLRMAMVKLQSCEYTQAIEICKPLLNSNGISPIAWYVLGTSYFGLGNQKEAFDAINKSLSLNDQNPGAWKLLGEIYILMDKIEQANKCLEKVWLLNSQKAA